MSGAGMMECKTALSESNGVIEEAFKILREKGIAKAEKKSSRDANEGLIGIKIVENGAAIIEVNSETDFVSRNNEFHKLVSDILGTTFRGAVEWLKVNFPELEVEQRLQELDKSIHFAR